MSKTILDRMPKLPEYKADYQVFYLEPIAHSGERFAVAVAAQSAKEHKVIQTIDKRIVKCMYGQFSENILGFISIITKSLEDHLSKEKPLIEWTSPLGSVYKSEYHTTFSNKGMEGILFQALTSYSSLYNGGLVTDAIDEILENEQQDEPENKNTRLITSVKTKLIEMNPVFKERFGRKIPIRKGGTVPVDYAGNRYNAALSDFNVRSVKATFEKAQAKLFQLEVLREDRANDTVGHHQEFEMLVSLKKNSKPEQQDLFHQIETMADTLDLRVIDKSDTQSIINHILRKEAA